MALRKLTYVGSPYMNPPRVPWSAHDFSSLHLPQCRTRENQGTPKHPLAFTNYLANFRVCKLNKKERLALWEMGPRTCHWWNGRHARHTTPSSQTCPLQEVTLVPKEQRFEGIAGMTASHTRSTQKLQGPLWGQMQSLAKLASSASGKRLVQA